MRVLYVYCHPLPESYHGALRAGLRSPEQFHITISLATSRRL